MYSSWVVEIPVVAEVVRDPASRPARRVQPGRHEVPEGVRVQAGPLRVRDDRAKLLTQVVRITEVSADEGNTHSHLRSSYRRRKIVITHSGGRIVRIPASEFVCGWTTRPAPLTRITVPAIASLPRPKSSFPDRAAFGLALAGPPAGGGPGHAELAR